MENLSSTHIGYFRVVCVSSYSWDEVNSSLRSQGFVLYNLESEGIVDKKSLLRNLVQSFELVLPDNDPLTSWDAASDLLWQVLMDGTANQVALLWKDSQKMLESNLQLFLNAIEFFQGVAETVERQENTTDTHSVLFRIVAFGTDQRYPPWSRLLNEVGPKNFGNS